MKRPPDFYVMNEITSNVIKITQCIFMWHVKLIASPAGVSEFWRPCELGIPKFIFNKELKIKEINLLHTYRQYMFMQ